MIMGNTRLPIQDTIAMQAEKVFNLFQVIVQIKKIIYLEL